MKIETIKKSALKDNNLPSYDINFVKNKEINGKYNSESNEIIWEKK